MVNDVTPDVIEKAINETKLLFVDCWAPWCGPCLALGPILDEIDQKYADNPDVRFLKINTQIHQEFAVEQNLYAIPCVLVYFDGKPAKFELLRSDKKEVTDRLIGTRPAEHYENVIRQLME